VVAASRAARAAETDLVSHPLRAMLNVEIVARVANDESHDQHLLALYLLRTLAHSEQPSELRAECLCVSDPQCRSSKYSSAW
jgi:hypothetical protein